MLYFRGVGLMIVYLNGKYVPKEEAVVSVFDHGLLYGDGVFEGIRAYHGRVFKLGEHLDRLHDGARALRLEIPYSKEEMQDIVLETLRRNNLQDAYIRLVITRGPGDLGLDRLSVQKLLSFALLLLSSSTRMNCMKRVCRLFLCLPAGTFPRHASPG